MPAESDVPLADETATLTAFLDTGRAAVAALCDGLTEEQARRSLVASRTTLLGLLQHCVRVEKVWFLEAIGGTGRDELGLPSNDDSFLIGPTDTIASVRARFEGAVVDSRRVAEGLALDTVATGWPGGAVSIRWILLHLIAEYARHAGHGDILREQILADP